MGAKERCSKRVYGGNHRFGGERCGNPAVALRTVRERKWVAAPERYDEETFTFVKVAPTETTVEVERWYCGTHDPERVAAREAKKEAGARETLAAAAERRCAALGAGRPEWRPNGVGVTGGVVLTATEADALVNRLRRVDAI